MPERKSKKHSGNSNRFGLQVRVCYHIGINGDYTPGMLIAEHYMQSIPVRYIKEVEGVVEEKVGELLKKFNGAFDIGAFRLSLHFKRKETPRKGRHLSQHKEKRLDTINRRVTRIVNSIELAIIFFFTSARQKLRHIFENMNRLLEDMRPENTLIDREEITTMLEHMKQGAIVEIENKL